jgi:hypothetical protein
VKSAVPGAPPAGTPSSAACFNESKSSRRLQQRPRLRFRDQACSTAVALSSGDLMSILASQRWFTTVNGYRQAGLVDDDGGGGAMGRDLVPLGQRPY